MNMLQYDLLYEQTIIFYSLKQSTSWEANTPRPPHHPRPPDRHTILPLQAVRRGGEASAGLASITINTLHTPQTEAYSCQDV